MNPYLQKLQALLGGSNKNLQVMAAPLVVVAVLTLMVLPLPAFVLDVFFTFNIASALMVMMVAATMVRPLDFAAFPRCCC
jgi:flagellar biosynthesis protein FlhA